MKKPYYDNHLRKEIIHGTDRGAFLDFHLKRLIFEREFVKTFKQSFIYKRVLKHVAR